LRQLPQLQDSIIIGCTSNVKSHRDALLGAGANAVWSKPIPSPAILQEDLKKLLNENQSKFPRRQQLNWTGAPDEKDQQR
jgi:CheY-like chemotaxis protein